MPRWEIHLELQAFARVECPIQYRVTGYFVDRDNWAIEDVEVPGQAGQHDWIRITRMHPFWAAYENYSNTPAFQRDVDNAIEREMQFDYEEVG